MSSSRGAVKSPAGEPTVGQGAVAAVTWYRGAYGKFTSSGGEKRATNSVILYVSEKNVKKELQHPPSLTSVARLVGLHPTKQRITSSISSQDTCLGCRFSSQLGNMEKATDRCFSLMLMSLSLSLPPFFSL